MKSWDECFEIYSKSSSSRHSWLVKVNKYYLYTMSIRTNSNGILLWINSCQFIYNVNNRKYLILIIQCLCNKMWLQKNFDRDCTLKFTSLLLLLKSIHTGILFFNFIPDFQKSLKKRKMWFWNSWRLEKHNSSYLLRLQIRSWRSRASFLERPLCISLPWSWWYSWSLWFQWQSSEFQPQKCNQDVERWTELFYHPEGINIDNLLIYKLNFSAYIGLHVGFGLVFQKQVDHLTVSLLSCLMQGSVTENISELWKAE